MIVKLIVEVNRGVSLTETQLENLKTHAEFTRIGIQSPTRKLYMCLIEHSLINLLIDFLTNNGFAPVIKRANKQDGTRLGFKIDENGDYIRDTNETDTLLADDDISAAFPQVQRTYEKIISFDTEIQKVGEIWNEETQQMDDVMGEVQINIVTETVYCVKKTYDANGDIITEDFDTANIDGDPITIQVPVTEPDMMDVLPETFMGWS